MKKPPKYSYSYMNRKLRNAVALMERQFENLREKGQNPPSEILDKYLLFLQEIDRIEAEPTVTELEDVKKRLSTVEARVSTIEAGKAAQKAYGR